MKLKVLIVLFLLSLPVYSQIFQFAGGKLFISEGTNLYRQTGSQLQFELLSFGPDNKTITLLYFSNESVGYAAKENELFRTSNGGSDWIKILELNGSLSSSSFSPDGQTVLVLGDSLKLYRSFNGGESFTSITLQIPLQNYSTISFAGTPNAGKVFLYAPYFNPFSGSMNYLVSRDSCSTWQLIESLGEKGMSGFISSKHGFVTTMSKLWLTSNGGESWDVVFQDAGLLSGHATFADSLTGYQGVYSSKLLLGTTDGGANWSELYRGTTELNAISAGKSNVAIREVGSESIKYSSDKGHTWQLVTLPLSIGSSKTEMPSAFRLFNNYPNPFNGSTLITFSVPDDLEVILEVFDSKGSLIDKKLPIKCQKGVNTIKYDSGYLPSGVWFYRLRTVGSENAALTGKMVILK